MSTPRRIRIDSCRVIDPTSRSAPDETRSLWIEGAHMASPPENADGKEAIFRFPNCIAMAGAIDAHTHIGGGKVNIARLMLPERRWVDPAARMEEMQSKVVTPLSCPVPNTVETGRRYLQMGYTTCFEPAILPTGARHAHMEMGDTPYLDTGGYLMLGNEELLLERLSQSPRDTDWVKDYIAWMLRAHQCLAIKVVHAGGVASFQRGAPLTKLDELLPGRRIASREILFALAKGVDELGLPHPVHVHCQNLGMAGNIETTLATIDAVEGHRIHLTHAQFHAYGEEGTYRFSSAAERLAEAVNQNPQVSIDVGQVLFGQTVTLSGDLPHQWENRRLARPKMGFFQTIENQGGCGVLPFRYRHSQFVHSLQWTIGLELFLRITNPWQIFLTTDHPNGAPFTSYPHLIRLLMDRDFRMHCFENLHPEVRSISPLPSLRREYTLEEIAVMTRAGPARSLGLHHLGSLQAGSQADLCIYESSENIELMFARPKMVISKGEIVYREGTWNAPTSKVTYRATPEYDKSITQFLGDRWPDYYRQNAGNARIDDQELIEMGGSAPFDVRCNGRERFGQP